MTDNFDNFIQRNKHGPRLTVLSGFFQGVTRGESGMPDRDIAADRSLLFGDALTEQFCDEYERRICSFSRHFLPSIPFMLENECRLGAALVEFGKAVAPAGERLKMYNISNAEGTFSRTLADFPGSRFTTLTGAIEPANETAFYHLGTPANAHFLLGSFLDNTPERIRAESRLAAFHDGFDIIFEHECFQMFSNERAQQFAFVLRMLKEDGMLILSEKLNQEDPAEFQRREDKKDWGFKARYFSTQDIEKKRSGVVDHMVAGQLTMKELQQALGQYFEHAVVFGNSTNFYHIVASNNESRIRLLLENMLPPCMEPDFCFETLPMAILGMNAEPPPTFGRLPAHNV
ncbi:hypothetical protein VSS37_02725 [Candidatus Thiothrix sp. Deng01]|uniref:Class I SAM-dependent methyltransferase n=1 Tax=Candidatus Thiothrix phosphatis TaxID=3112415 RepID=A0ABU6CU17_9GAMM|nr:hypothetical protein [Candidatus Thiothrix sp. Deng01]MEB4589883.1 hypothetical protein [Candidatus Thiothrix sp. Deng01]